MWLSSITIEFKDCGLPSYLIPNVPFKGLSSNTLATSWYSSNTLTAFILRSLAVALCCLALCFFALEALSRGSVSISLAFALGCIGVALSARVPAPARAFAVHGGQGSAQQSASDQQLARRMILLEALLLSYSIPTAPRKGRSPGHSTLPYILAVNNRGEQLEQAADLGAELSMQLPNGAHPLFGAAMFGRLQSLEVLIKHCQETALDLANSRGTTPLMVAAMHGQETAFARLRQAGADNSRRNCDGHTAADLSEQQKINRKPQNHVANRIHARSDLRSPRSSTRHTNV
mmetsp:Transcript_50676/g.93723  ORF Transcript_50676/g.93723 Transcript_50676/m.93723 type:complete len:289 (-) Transcript_50676:71-937(-)